MLRKENRHGRNVQLILQLPTAYWVTLGRATYFHEFGLSPIETTSRNALKSVWRYLRLYFEGEQRQQCWSNHTPFICDIFRYFVLRFMKTMLHLTIKKVLRLLPYVVLNNLFCLISQGSNSSFFGSSDTNSFSSRSCFW